MAAFFSRVAEVARVVAVGAVGVATAAAVAKNRARGTLDERDVRALRARGLFPDLIRDLPPSPESAMCEHDVTYCPERDCLVWKRSGKWVDTRGEAREYVVTKNGDVRISREGDLRHSELASDGSVEVLSGGGSSGGGGRVAVVQAAGMAKCSCGSCKLNWRSGHFKPTKDAVEAVVGCKPPEFRRLITVRETWPGERRSMDAAMHATDGGDDPLAACHAKTFRDVIDAWREAREARDDA